ncbi:hypothetical protein Ssed_2001 [Shewanella sediminis HAW-EB3]|uniref:Uncharacterized protein n=1 Tax=Shewanella sediminis (strain HAW-EB3) TaxID=425104 RepID=A8FUT7_SHESH|nr:hypothetical protein [Shewanella sediminis]ABV36610.1 hypothetical protein Ssed_2001 [Shewanella sediminis HAW-EB3]
MRDKNGDEVIVGNVVRLLQLPDVGYDKHELKDVSTMVGECFTVESIEYECVEINKWFGSGDDKFCHTLFLWPEEIEFVSI